MIYVIISDKGERVQVNVESRDECAKIADTKFGKAGWVGAVRIQ